MSARAFQDHPRQKPADRLMTQTIRLTFLRAPPLRPLLQQVARIFAVILVLSGLNVLARGDTHIVDPGQSIQQVIDRAANGDTIVLKDGVYYESLKVHHSITLKAEHGGEAIVTNRYSGSVAWRQASPNSQTWFAEGIDWPVHRLLVEGVHAFDYRSKQNFDNRTCGPYLSKGWQAGSSEYTAPPIYFARDAPTRTLWLHLNDARNPNKIAVDFNSRSVGGKTLVQKDLGAYWNQQ